jgi:flagellar protein FliO/FliZ
MEDVSVVALLARLVVSLGVVLVLMWVAARLLARQSTGRRVARNAGRPVPIQVLARQSLSKNSSVAVVQAAGKALVVGVTDAQVTLLAQSDIESVVEPDVVEDPATTITAAAGTRSPWALPRDGGATAFSPWTAMLETLRERTVRKS